MRKRFIITIVLFGTFVFAHGQQTVIPFGQRLPYLYYWDSNWYDSVILKYPLCSSGDYDFIYSSTLPRYMQGDKFIGRVCITDYPLRVIGIAAAAKIVDTAKRSGARVSGPIPLPTKKEVICPLPGPFIWVIKFIPQEEMCLVSSRG